MSDPVFRVGYGRPRRPKSKGLAMYACGIQVQDARPPVCQVPSHMTFEAGRFCSSTERHGGTQRAHLVSAFGEVDGIRNDAEQEEGTSWKAR